MVFGVVFLFGYVVAHVKSAAGRSTLAFLLMVGFVSLPLAVVIYWQGTADAYGWRYLFSLLVLGFLGLFFVHEALRAGARTRVPYRITFSALAILGVVGLASQVFWGTSERLHFVSGENILGIHTGTGHCCSARGYLTKLAEDVPKISTWVNMAAQRYPGFVAAVILDTAGIDLATVGARLGIPPDKLSAGMERYAGVSGQIVVQLLVLYLFSVAAVLFIWNMRGPARSN
jgi:phosphoglycerol transferase MdoB-like AlkP superfamily enzyme